MTHELINLPTQLTQRAFFDWNIATVKELPEIAYPFDWHCDFGSPQWVEEIASHIEPDPLFAKDASEIRNSSLRIA